MYIQDPGSRDSWTSPSSGGDSARKAKNRLGSSTRIPAAYFASWVYFVYEERGWLRLGRLKIH